MCDIRQHRRYGDDDVKDGLVEAVRLLVDQDCYLLEHALYEPTLTHRIAAHLEGRFETYDVDCEYDQNMGGPKFIQAYGNARPDILVHCRGHSAPWNLLAVEAKKVGNNCENDLAKLQGLKDLHGVYSYQVVALVLLGTQGAIVDFGDGHPRPVGVDVPAAARPGWLLG